MNCLICDKETDMLMKNVPCCRDCRQTVYTKRDEMAKTFKELKEEANGLNKNPEVIRKYQECPFGTIENALIKLGLERNDNLKGEKNE